MDLNTCLVLALNNVCGVPLIRTLKQALNMFYRIQCTNSEEELLRFVIDKGFTMRLNVGFIPFIDYDGALGLLGLREAGKWTQEELCTLPYSCEYFNAYMSTHVKSLRALIRMDWCSAAGDLTQNSHVIAAHYSSFHNAWML